ncbi:MAG TPA: family 78 glycoside hydrolase catalytic domain [Clostridiales bacterium]|nr:family 78 glycoside hydrolase catalytic domain [Clostridiales bacterium]
MKRLITLLTAAAVLFSFVSFPVPIAQAAGSLSVYDLTCEYLTNPEVIDRQQPVLRWKIASKERGVLQAAYRVTAASSLEKLQNGQYDAYDSGKVQSADNAAFYEGEMASGADYYWQVEVWDNKGNSAKSAPAKFGVGLLNEEDWSGASWISPTVEEDPADSYSYSVSMKFMVVSENSKSSKGASIIFGVKDTANYYMYQIRTPEQPTPGCALVLKPHERVNGRWVNDGVIPIPFDVIPEDEAFNTWHEVRFDYDNGTVTTTINSTVIDTRTFVNKFVSTRIGFRAYVNQTSDERGRYDDITVTKDGERAFFDDLSDSNFEYDIIQGAGQVNYKDGGVEFVSNQDDFIVFSKQQEEDGDKEIIEKYTLECRFAIEKVACGIIFGALDSRNFYMWQIDTRFGAGNQQVLFRPHEWVGGSPSLIAEVNISSVISWGNRFEPHVMKIEVDGNTVTTYIDGVKIDTRTVGRKGYGNLGFRHGASPDELSRIDWIKATDKDGKVLFEENFEDGLFYQFIAGTVAGGWLRVGQGEGGEFCWQTGIHNTYIMRKDFNVKHKTVKRAKIYSSALGIYEMYINGKRVGNDYFAPGWTDYNKRVQYQGYDVTGLVKPGENVWGVMTAPGWFSGWLAFGSTDMYGPGTAFIGKLVIDYSDGTSDVIVSDKSWKANVAPVVSADILNGEYYDARLEPGGSPTAWATAAVDAADWGRVLVRHKKALARNLVAQVDPPVQTTEELAAVDMWENEGRIVVDFGQNFAGVVRAKLKGEPGQRIRLRFSEGLDKNRAIDNLNYRNAKATDYYVIGESGQGVYQPRFTFHGFRYAEITGMSIEDFKLQDIVGVVYGSNLKRTSSFESSNEMVNQLYSNILWSQRANYLSVPTDCPQRDERLGWTGDSQVFVRTGSYNMDTAAFYRKHLIDIVDAQRSDGAYPDVAPNISFGSAGNAAWGDAGVIGAYTIYLHYGDKRILEENYPAMKKWIAYYQSIAQNNIIPNCAYGDWLSVNESTPNDLVATAFYAYSTKLVAKTAEILGHEEEAQNYDALFEEIKQAYVNRFVQPSGMCGNGSQGSYVLSLAFELVPEGLCQKAADLLAQNIIVKNNGHLTTGFVTVGRICPVLTKYGHSDVAYRLLTNTTYPSWGYSIERGATTIWERWNSCLDDGTIDNSMIAMNSLNHYSFGAIGEWMFKNALGIEVDEENPGFRHIILQPVPFKYEERNITYMKGAYDSIHGEIFSGWSFDSQGNLIYEVKVPANTTATLRLPIDRKRVIYENGSNAALSEGVEVVEITDSLAAFRLGSGHYKFSYSKEASVIVEEEVLVGDLNGDGRLTVVDVVAMRGIIMSGQAPTQEQLLYGDINEDGKITVVDVVALRRLIMNSE